MLLASPQPWALDRRWVARTAPPTGGSLSGPVWIRAFPSPAGKEPPAETWRCAIFFGLPGLGYPAGLPQTPDLGGGRAAGGGGRRGSDDCALDRERGLAGRETGGLGLQGQRAGKGKLIRDWPSAPSEDRQVRSGEGAFLEAGRDWEQRAPRFAALLLRASLAHPCALDPERNVWRRGSLAAFSPWEKGAGLAKAAASVHASPAASLVRQGERKPRCPQSSEAAWKVAPSPLVAAAPPGGAASGKG